MKARPSKEYYCDNCDECHEGSPTQTGPVFVVGCCFSLEWEGTREQATELYDYLQGQGFLNPSGSVQCGDCGAYDEIGSEYVVWTCGECNRGYSTDEFTDAQLRATRCCQEKLRERQEALMEEEGV